MLRTMDTEHFCEQINVSARRPHSIMNWRDRDHTNKILTSIAGASRNSRKHHPDDKFPDHRRNEYKLQRQPLLLSKNSASHRLRIHSSEQHHIKKLNISNNFNNHSSQTFEH